MNPLLSLLAVFLLLTFPATAQEIGTMTLVEGPLRLIRGATVLQGTEGVRLHTGDIIESSDKGFVQLRICRRRDRSSRQLVPRVTFQPEWKRGGTGLAERLAKG